MKKYLLILGLICIGCSSSKNTNSMCIQCDRPKETYSIAFCKKHYSEKKERIVRDLK